MIKSSIFPFSTGSTGQPESIKVTKNKRLIPLCHPIQPDRLILVDAIRNKGKPGDLYHLEGEGISDRIRVKNSLHQVDFLEALTLCQALDKVPETVIVGVEPEDIETMSIELTRTTEAKVDAVIDMVLAEPDCLGVPYKKGRSDNVFSNPIPDYKD